MLNPRETPGSSRTAITRLFKIGGSRIEVLEESRFEQPGTHVGDKQISVCAMRAILRPQLAPSSSGRLSSFRPASLASENETGGVFIVGLV